MSLVASEPAALERSQHGWLSWAAFLGMSWTWCIGMFLPVILLRDYGIAGWIVFAVPNVLGAAAMGWVIRSAESSRVIAERHRLAGTIFSGVTIAFHLFFVVAIIAPLARSMVVERSGNGPASEALDLAAGGMVAGAILMYLYITRRPDGERTLSWLTLAISVAVMIFMVPELESPIGSIARMNSLLGSSPSDLFWLAPVCVFGFLFCPYLDLTFHRARQLSENARASFGVGFGGMFLPMIVFTALYAPALNGAGKTSWIASLLYVHLSVQSAFTVAAHARELRNDGRVGTIVAAVLAVIAVLLMWFLPRRPMASPMMPWELIYRSFMGFYGLIFPAYVWLIMLPGRGKAAPKTKQWILFAAAVGIALPMFSVGFLWQKMFWLVPGLAVVLLARLVIPAGKATELAEAKLV